MMHKQKLVVIGGGASGFFCAVNAARLHPHLEVILLEKSSKLLSKVKVSGGGRCNVTHQSDEVADMLHAYPRGMRLIKKTLHQFSPNDTVQWFEERGVQLKIEEDGRLFPVSNSSQSVIDCLLREAEQYKVVIQTNTDVAAIDHNSAQFELVIK
jgi:predicted Rossmann fold flavoprotein